MHLNYQVIGLAKDTVIGWLRLGAWLSHRSIICQKAADSRLWFYTL